MVGTNLVRLVPSHEQTDVVGGPVSEELHFSCTSLLPLGRLSITVIAEQLSPPESGHREEVTKRDYSDLSNSILIDFTI
jgi:hypothetical protein